MFLPEINNNTTNKAPNAAFTKTRNYFLGKSLRPSENVPDLLAENRKIAISLAESVMSLIDVIAQHFGIQTMELAMSALPEVSLHLEVDGIWEQAVARTYLDLKGAVPLADICKGAYAYPVPTLHCVAQEILRRERFARYAPNDPLLKRIFGGIDEGECPLTAKMSPMRTAMANCMRTMFQRKVHRKTTRRGHNTTTLKILINKGFTEKENSL